MPWCNSANYRTIVGSVWLQTGGRYRYGSKAVGRKLYAFALIAIAFLIMYAVTVQDTPGDTRDYVSEVLHYQQNRATTPPSALWEFGHLFWRPLGYALWQLTTPLTSVWFHGNPMIEISGVFWALTFVSGLVMVLLVLAIAVRLGVKRPGALTIAFGVLLCSAVLNYIHSGTPYIPGLALQMAGLWLVVKAVQEERGRTLNEVLAGCALALGCALWFPYFFGIPAVLIAALVLPAGTGARRVDRERLSLFTSVVGSTIFFGFAFFAIGATLAHVGSLVQLREWILSSGHGMQSHQRLLRFPTGITRTFFYLGDEGMVIKRFVFHDPYAPVSWWTIVGGLWKIALVFLTFASLIAVLAYRRGSRWTVAIIVFAIVPTLFFAVFIFEPSSAERYLPMFAGLVIAVCVLLRDQAAPRPVAWLLTLFVTAMAAVNLAAYAGKLPSEARRSSDRFALIHSHVRSGGVAIVLSVSDPLTGYFEKSPFDPRNQATALPLYQAIGVHAHEFNSWKADSACRILQAWQAGGDALLSDRLIARTPKPDWGWVENDDPNVHWADLRRFYSHFDVDEKFGRSDGFVRVARDPKNESTLAGDCPVSHSFWLVSSR